MNRAFLDTVGLIALLSKQDQWHTVARESYESLKAEPCQFVTTSFVMAEVGNAAARTQFRMATTMLHRELIGDDCLKFPTESEYHIAWRAYEQSHVGGPSIVDCISFEVMRRLSVSRVFTNDKHFVNAGFETLF